jgi:rod shape-determining protein MreC
LKNSIAIILAIFVLVVSFLSFTNTPVVVKTFTAIKGGLNVAIGPALKVIGKPIDGLRLLGFMEKKPNTLIAAKVIGEDLKNWFRCIIIDKGKSQGLREKMPVITPKGIVGQVVVIDQWHSKVMIINDTNSSIDVNIDGKSTRGLLEGTGQNILKLKYVIKNDAIEIGDKLFTSGKDGIFPKGIPAGIVMTVDRNKAGIFADIDVMPFNNFKQLDEVLIIKKQ